MKNNKLVVSTLVAGLLAAAGTASAAPMDQKANHGNITPAKSAEHAAKNTLTKKVKDARGELKATQPGAVEVNTTKDVSDVQRNMQRQADRAQREANRVEAQADAAENALRGDNANLADVTPARERAHAARNTLNQKVEDARGELKATQPGRVEVNERAAREKRGNNAQNSDAQNNNAQMNNANAATGNVVRSGKPISKQPLLKGEAQTGQAEPTLQQRVKDRVGELQATQPGEVEVQESRSIRVQ